MIEKISPEQTGEITSLVKFGDVRAHLSGGEIDYVHIEIMLKRAKEADEFIKSLKIK